MCLCKVWLLIPLDPYLADAAANFTSAGGVVASSRTAVVIFAEDVTFGASSSHVGETVPPPGEKNPMPALAAAGDGNTSEAGFDVEDSVGAGASTWLPDISSIFGVADEKSSQKRGLALCDSSFSWWTFIDVWLYHYIVLVAPVADSGKQRSKRCRRSPAASQTRHQQPRSDSNKLFWLCFDIADLCYHFFITCWFRRYRWRFECRVSGSLHTSANRCSGRYRCYWGWEQDCGASVVQYVILFYW